MLRIVTLILKYLEFFPKLLDIFVRCNYYTTKDYPRGGDVMEPKTFGQMFKELRLKSGYTLRGFCKAINTDPGNISKMERGILPPPRDQNLLEAYAAAFKLKHGTVNYETFFELAVIDAGKIPQKVLSDEELMSRLPVLFRTITGKKIDGKKLDEFIEQLRRS